MAFARDEGFNQQVTRGSALARQGVATDGRFTNNDPNWPLTPTIASLFASPYLNEPSLHNQVPAGVLSNHDVDFVEVKAFGLFL